METLLSENRIFKQRTVDIGVISEEDALSLGITGPCLRSPVLLGIYQTQPYDAYEEMDFDIPIGKTGDCYARYLVRIEEMRQSLWIIDQAIACLPSGPIIAPDHKVTAPKRGEMKQSMEALIHHFKLYTEGFHVPAGESYTAVEAPKGEFWCFFVADGTNKPYRCKIRAPGFYFMAAVDHLSAAICWPT